MALDLAVNFAKSALASGITSGAGSLTLVTGGGAKFAAVPWNGVIYNSTDYSDPSDDPAVEIVRCTLISTDTLTITRAQESTTGVAHNTAGKTYTLVAGPTSKLLTDIYSLGLKGGRQYWKSTQSVGMQSTGVAFGATLPVLGGGTGRTSFTDGQVVFPLTSGAQTLTGSANLFWDSSNNRLGILTAAPGSPLTVAGQIETTSTGVKFPDATVQSTAYSSTGILRTLKETVFAGITPASYTNGNTYTIDGCAYTATVPGNGAIDMVATGLRMRRGTTGGTAGEFFDIVPGATGNFASIVGEARFRRGRWGVWSRIASYDFTNTASGNTWAGLAIVTTYPKWGIQNRNRARAINGAPNTTTGGIAFDHWLGGSDINPNSYPGVSTADVILTYFRSFDSIEVYYGTYSGGWPTMESMTLMGRVNAGSVSWLSAATSSAGNAALVDMYFEFGSAAPATTGTFEVIFDRWRITTWE
jgi:hypothetical protein